MTESIKKLYGDKDEMAYLFGLNRNTVSNDLTAMRRLPQFAGYVLNISHKRVAITIVGYEAYLKYQAERQKCRK